MTFSIQLWINFICLFFGNTAWTNSFTSSEPYFFNIPKKFFFTPKTKAKCNRLVFFFLLRNSWNIFKTHLSSKSSCYKQANLLLNRINRVYTTGGKNSSKHWLINCLWILKCSFIHVGHRRLRKQICRSWQTIWLEIRFLIWFEIRFFIR